MSEPAAAASAVKQEVTVTAASGDTTAAGSDAGAAALSSPSPPSPSVDASLARRLLAQVEFYFSNSNLPKDSFLRGLYDSDPEHWVDLSVIASFKRMREFLSPSLSESQLLRTLSALIPSSADLRLSSDGAKVTRAAPLPDHYDPTDSTVLASGFPPASVSIDSVRGFFEQLTGEGSVLSVRLRKAAAEAPKGRAAKKESGSGSGSGSASTAAEAEGEAEAGPTGDAAAAVGGGVDAAADADSGGRSSFDGSAWVEFSDSAKADQVAATGKYAYELVKKQKEEGQTDAQAEQKEDSRYDIAVLSKRQFLAGLKRDRKGDRDRDAAMKPDRGEKRKRRAGDKDGSSAEGGAADEGKEGAAGGDDGDDGDGDEAEADPDADRSFAADLLLRFDTVNQEATTRESLRAFCESVGCAVQFVDFSKGEQAAVVRLADDTPVKASDAARKLKGDAEGAAAQQLDGTNVELRAMAGEEESAYWRAVWRQMREVKEKRAGDKRGRGRGGRGGRGGGRGGRGRGGSRGRGGRGGRGSGKKQKT